MGVMPGLGLFKGISNPREVIAWGLYDLANQSFTLLIITLLFPLYFKEIAVGDSARGDALWSAGAGFALFIVVALSPIVGSVADAHSARKKVLIGTGFVCAALTCALALVAPGMWWLGLVLFIPANICYQLGENMLASFLPSLSTPRTIGRVSGIGWSMGYAGSLALLVLVLGGVKLFGLNTTGDWRPFFILAGVWFAIWMIPALLVLDEPERHEIDPEKLGLGLIAARMKRTIRDASRFKQLTRFLVAFFVYGLGVQTMIMFAAILASDFGIKEMGLVVFTLQIAVTAGLSAVIVSRVQDRIGIKVTIAFFLVVWILSSGSLLLVKLIGPTEPPQWIFWVIGNGIGLGLGGIGTSSRAMVGFFAPKQRVGEFFGLWGMTYKLAGAIGVLSFGQVKAWIGDAPALALLCAFFGAGLVLLARVNMGAGIRAARRADKDPLQ